MLDFFNKEENCLDKLIFVLLFIFMLLPFFIMAFFNYPSGDDFITANNYFRLGTINSAVSSWLNHTGRYSAVFFTDSIFNPLTYDKTFVWYKFYSFLNIGFFIFCVWFFINSLNKFYIKMSAFKVFVVLFVVLFMFLTNMRSTAEFFYWFTGVCVYTISLELFLLAIGLWIYFINTKYNLLNFVNYIFILVLMFLVMGGHEPFSGWLVFISSYYLYWVFRNKKSYKYAFLGLFIIIIAGFLLMYLAPGNKSRMMQNRDVFADTNILKMTAVIFITIGRNAYGIIKWFFSINILMPFVLIFYCLEEIKKINLNKYVLISFFVYMFLCYFIPFCATYNIPYVRVINIIYFTFVLAVIYGFCYLIKWLDHKSVFVNINNYRYLRFLVLLFIFFNSLFYSSNIRDAYLELYTGKAIMFYEDRELMFNAIKNSKEDIVFVDDAVYAPRTTYMRDPYTKSPFIAEYFKKKDVIINWEKSITDKEVDLMRGAVIKRFIKKKLGFKELSGYKEKI